MAEETERLGLPRYTSGSDLHPTREDFNDRMELIDDLAAIARQGDHDERPMPGTRGLLWFSRDRRELWWDTGDEWEQVAPVGSSGSNTAIRVGSPDSTDEGESRRIARADHTHSIPLATSDEPGAMSAADKELLDTATSDTDNNAIVRRLPNGRIGSANPTSDHHLTNRTWVEAEIDRRITDALDAREQSYFRYRGLWPDGQSLEGIQGSTEWLGIWRATHNTDVGDLPPGFTSGQGGYVIEIYAGNTPGAMKQVVSDDNNSWWRESLSSSNAGTWNKYVSLEDL